MLGNCASEKTHLSSVVFHPPSKGLPSLSGLDLTQPNDAMAASRSGWLLIEA
jgi:hypothetical protein